MYYPFPDSNAVWREYESGTYASSPPVGECYDYENRYMGDTIIGAFTYKKIWKYGAHYGYNCSTYINPINYYVGAIRQDTLQRKIYFLPPFQNTDTLLYDFNLSLGDTLPPSYTNCTTNIVSSVDSVLVGAMYRKRFGLGYTYLIEGIGNTFGLLQPICFMLEPGSQLNCFGIVK